MTTKDAIGAFINDNGDAMRDGPCVASMIDKYFASVLSPRDSNNLSLINTSTYRVINVLSHRAFLVYYLQEAEELKT